MATTDESDGSNFKHYVVVYADHNIKMLTLPEINKTLYLNKNS